MKIPEKLIFYKFDQYQLCLADINMQNNLTIIAEHSRKNAAIIAPSETDYRLQPMEKTVGFTRLGLDVLFGLAGFAQRCFHP
jgi:hypothetical protein